MKTRGLTKVEMLTFNLVAVLMSMMSLSDAVNCMQCDVTHLNDKIKVLYRNKTINLVQIKDDIKSLKQVIQGILTAWDNLDGVLKDVATAVELQSENCTPNKRKSVVASKVQHSQL